MKNAINYVPHFRRRAKCAISDISREFGALDRFYLWNVRVNSTRMLETKLELPVDCAGKSITIGIVSINRNKQSQAQSLSEITSTLPFTEYTVIIKRTLTILSHGTLNK